MTFLYPLGLLGLLGIPVLILIYIIKSKYTEQTVSSTYLWKLSERFLKKKNPLSRLTGLISLILQILCVLTISLTIAHPVLRVPGAARDYCFILDGSGSMQMMHEEGDSRYEVGKARIADMITDAVDGSTFTLIHASDKTVTVYCIDKNNNNPYRMWERAGKPEMTDDMLKALREEGRLKPTGIKKGSEPITLKLTPNCTYLITVTE